MNLSENICNKLRNSLRPLSSIGKFFIRIQEDRIRVSPPYLQYRNLAQCSRTSTAKGKQRGLSLIADHGFPINRTTKTAHELNIVRRGCLFVASCKGGEVTMVETCQDWASRDATITAGETLDRTVRKRSR
ncbi:hypothetical protein PILCRDRAFT_307879 [Piloderma croceum F 1598]|uniref:Uncharacterized protein n=1 Tax=Piloderma croceum (strain F 1598) TaxID=765440 RepID=A0A0C3CA08_PILCF|nr:hypothetical protein PILCRDRAFT_307879 [Piloderma croceum F 1598]